MPNTVIQLKKSSTPGSIPLPANLANGELAINYADGKLYYKAANGVIASISGNEPNYFGAVNASGTLVVADTPGDVFTIEAGTNITITADAINDKITISSTGGGGDISPAFIQANTARDQANAAFDKANSANVLAFNTGLGANAFTSATIAGANTAVGAGANAYAAIVGTSANVFTSATIAGANTAVGTGANAYANLVWSRSNTYADTVGAGANAFMIAVQNGSNTAIGTGANAFASATIAGANTAVGTGANAFTSATIAGANTAVGAGANAYASIVGTSANTVGIAAFLQANVARTHANAAFLSSNSVNTFSSATFVRLTAASQTITGNVNIVGDLTLSGNTFTIDATRLEVDDPLIYLAANNYSSDTVDIGFIGNYVNATGANVHTGLYREHTDKMYYLFQGYDKEPVNNHIGALSNNMTLAVLNADIRTSNLVLGGANAILTIAGVGTAANNFAIATIAGANTAVGAGANSVGIAAFTQANTARTHANAAFATANAALPSSSYTASDVLSKLLTVDGSGSNLDADLLDGQHGSFYSTDTKATAAFGQANTAQTTGAAAFGQANTAQTTGAAAFSKANTAGTDAINAFAKANTALPNTSGATFAGNLTVSQNLSADRIFSTNNGNGENFKVGDDAWIGDVNLADTLRIKGQQNSTRAYIIFGDSDATALGRQGSNALTYGGSTVWHAGNDGAGSGLDADLLDGQHGSFYSTDTKATAAFGQANTALTTGQAAFAKANSALANTTGTFAGNLTLTGNLAITGSLTVSSNVINFGTAMSILANGMIMIYGDINMLT